MIYKMHTLISTSLILILCRTPFLNGDWPDSISELDFDCNESQQGDLLNCDAHSDIGPSCSAHTDRNK